MILKNIFLQNFRSYESFVLELPSEVTVIAGANTAGKTNLIEAISMISTGKSFRVEKDIQMIKHEQDIGRVKSLLLDDNARITLEVTLARGELAKGRFMKRFAVNDVGKRRVDFAGLLSTVLFSPEELDLVSGGPSLRRRFLNDVLEQVDNEYRHAIYLYEKAVRQRNALLDNAKETGRKNMSQFAYWDELLITNGQIITNKRQQFIDYLNEATKDIFSFQLEYDKSTISAERLVQYEHAELGAGVTLVGPHRDDVLIYMNESEEVKYFGSRGQQRLVVLQLKLLQLNYIKAVTQKKPLLLLDDIFSELDNKHMELVMDMIHGQQVIMTTTHKEFITDYHLTNAKVVELELGESV